MQSRQDPICTPTPTSTVYAESTSFLTLFTTTTTSYVQQAEPITSTITTSSCAAYKAVQHNAAVETPQLTPAEDTAIPSESQNGVEGNPTQTGEDQWGRWGNDLGVNAKHRAWRTITSSTSAPQATVSAAAKGDLGVLALAQDDTTGSSGLPSDIEDDCEFEDVSSTLTAAKPTGAMSVHERRFLGAGSRSARLMIRQNEEECEQWATSTSFSIVTPAAETQWSTVVETITQAMITQVPVSTLYSSCPTVVINQKIQEEQQPASSAVKSATPTAAEIDSEEAQDAAPTSTSSVTEDGWQQSDTGAVASTAESETWTASSKGDVESVYAAASMSETSSSLPVPPTTLSVPPVKTTMTMGPVSTGEHNPLAANANQGPSSRASPVSSQGTSNAEQDDPGLPDHTGLTMTSKGITAGAAIGGVVGICLLITAILMAVRWYKKRQNGERERIMRSSWYYGGDLGDPGEGGPAAPSRVMVTSMNRRESMMQSRFSAPSLMSRASGRFSHHMPNFIAQPISHIRQHSGRFPHVIADIRKTFQNSKEPKPMAQWAEKYRLGSNEDLAETMFSPIPPVPARASPIPLTLPQQGSAMSRQVTLTRPPPPPPPRSPSPQSPVQLESIVSGVWTNVAPRLELNHTAGDSLDWGHSYIDAPPNTVVPPPGIPFNAFDNASRYSTASSRTGHSYNVPLESYYSVYSNTNAMSYTPQTFVGQALTAPGRDSIEVASIGGAVNPHVTPRPPPVRAPSSSRNLVPLPMAVQHDLPNPSAPFLGIAHLGDHTSSLFEYSDFNEGNRTSMMTTKSNRTARQTKNWYDKPLWDGAGPDGVDDLPQVPGHPFAMPHGNRISRSKSVRWDDEQEPRVFELARAL